jgi:RimJ/RimL family protein N-acetyltransferase
MIQLSIRLRDGTPVMLRPVLPEDRDRLQSGLLQMSAESRYQRFFSPVRGLTEEQLRYFTEVDQEKHVAWIGLDASSAGLPGIGIARFIRMEERPTMAEVACAVVDALQERGLGTALLAILYLMAQARGIETLRAFVLAENTKIVSWLGHLGAHGKLQPEGVVKVDLGVQCDLSHLPQNNTARLFAEFVTQFERQLCVRNKHSS